MDKRPEHILTNLNIWSLVSQWLQRNGFLDKRYLAYCLLDKWQIGISCQDRYQMAKLLQDLDNLE